MLGLLRRRLADLGTAKKLAIGFTLVLLLTALVAALAVLSLHALGQRFARLQEMSAINRDVLEVRQAEKDFALHGEKSDAERLRQRLAATLERVGRLKADGDADQALGMAEVEQVLAAYLEAFGRFEQSIQGRQLAWESASWSLNGAANSLDILQSSLAEDGAYALKESQGRDGEPLLQQAAQVAQVNRLVLQGWTRPARVSKRAPRMRRRGRRNRCARRWSWPPGWSRRSLTMPTCRWSRTC